VILNSKI